MLIIPTNGAWMHKSNTSVAKKQHPKPPFLGGFLRGKFWLIQNGQNAIILV